MSIFLSAAENDAGQRQNVQRNLKKMEKECRAVELALENHNLFIFGLYCTGKMFQVTKRQLYSYFWYHCDAVDAR